MSMAIRERRTEIAVLKTLGFSSALVLALVLGEALVIGSSGGGARRRAAGALLLSQRRHASQGLNGFGAALELSPALLVAMLALSALIGLLSGLTPAVSAYRANITSMLRQV